MVYYNPVFKGREFKNHVLLIGSLLFYAWGEPVVVLLMCFSIFVVWKLGRFIEKTEIRHKRKGILWVGVLYNLVILYFFKYFAFTVEQINFVDFKVQIPLPIGISFFTFQLLSYLFDIYYNRVHAQTNVANVALYIALFPQLIAGPIVRYETIEKQIMVRNETLDNFTDGMMRFIYGLGKKMILANYAAQIADNIFEAGVPTSVGTAWIGAVAYTLQIYFDFSGYSDMAIGLGLMFGFSLPENFNYPYIAKSVTEFWRRWNITLGLWFRDYVYIPLGGNRVSVNK